MTIIYTIYIFEMIQLFININVKNNGILAIFNVFGIEICLRNVAILD